ncbi:hypothetical protein F2Q70_00025525 [Brassica cretica]|uniref:Uncharacterized protein n=1 Tax=Brassica cretica TaxID=69181 RepID=A0A8S9I9A3_BRACR|nr:hypothetical protein F2Q68_00024932 [Brassica cretica]KAF2602328.1 hypothetical protein F2Q70_00025525 [Brassica cretica]
MVRISGFGDLVSDSQSDGMRYAFDPSSGGKIFCRLCNYLSWSIGTISSSCFMTQMMEELFNRFHNTAMEMEGSVVVLFTLQEISTSLPTKVHAQVNVRVTTSVANVIWVLLKLRLKSISGGGGGDEPSLFTTTTIAISPIHHPSSTPPPPSLFRSVFAGLRLHRSRDHHYLKPYSDPTTSENEARSH